MEDTNGNKSDYVTFRITDQLFGIPVLKVQDVLGDFEVTPVPTARPEISGSLNLRGHIVTAINVRTRLGLENKNDNNFKPMSIVVEHKENLYSLIIDQVGDVMTLPDDGFDKNPSTLDPLWQKISEQIFQLENELLVILDIPAVLNINNE